MAIKCLDTYALVEINFGNPNFMPLLTQEIIITDITLTEFYGDIYKKYNLKTADYWYRKAGEKRPEISLDEEWEFLFNRFFSENH